MEETKQETPQETSQLLNEKQSPFKSITATVNPFVNNGKFGKRFYHTAHLIGDHIVVIFGYGKDYNGRDLCDDR